jgi:hypothetical protein
MVEINPAGNKARYNVSDRYYFLCNIRCNTNNQHCALICTTPLFYLMAPTCFSSSLPSSGNFLDTDELPEIQTE